MLRKHVLVLLTTFLSTTLFAQSPSAEFESGYKTAKKLMELGKYGLSMQSFKSLMANTEENDLTPYAQYYMAYSAYMSGDKSFAKDAFLQITIKHEDWAQIDAAYLWLSQIGFELSGPFKGMLYASKIAKEPYLSKSKKFIEIGLKGLSVDVLATLHQEYEDNAQVGEAYALALSKEPATQEKDSVMNKLITQFGFDRERFTRIPLSKVKDQYEIGILLPLFIDRIEASGKYLKKSLAVDIYEGAVMAAHDVDSTLFTLHVFDTKKDTAQLNRMMNNGALKEMDAVLGPLYPDLIEKMESYAAKNQLNFVNPTSSNPYIASSSPYAFLSRAGADQLAAKAADYMVTQPVNKNLFIYYGTSDVDSVSAYIYKEKMEADSFNVVLVQRIGNENRRQVYDGLTASETVVDREKIAKMTREEIERAIQLPTTDSLLIQPDSIGHIFIASSDPVLPTEAMSAIISRGDSIKIMGVGNWFESENAGLSIMEGLGVTLAISAFDDVSTAEYRQLTRRYIEKYKRVPGKYFFRGYYAMKFIASSLKNYGTYFQNGYKTHGNFDSTMDFEHTNTNGSVRIIRMEDNKITEQSIVRENSEDEGSSKY